MQAIGWDDIAFVGAGLVRPECVLTTRSGHVLASDARGGVSILDLNGTVRFIAAKGAPEGFLPNGIALMPDRTVLIANLGPSGGIWSMQHDGQVTPVLLEVDGTPLPPTNFVGLDREHRVWITVSTRLFPRENAFRKGWADGFVAVLANGQARIVADGLGYTNEAIVDPSGRWLYVNETIARRTVRFPVTANGDLGLLEIVAEYPPATFPDGFAFDAEGGVWTVSVGSNRLIRVAPDGRQTILIEDQSKSRLEEIGRAFDADTFGRNELDAGRSRALGNLSSLAFGGPDLKTVYLGSLHGNRLATFRSPIAGARPVQWEFPIP